MRENHVPLTLEGKETFEITCMMRSGSTLLCRLFDSHPNVISTSESQPMGLKILPSDLEKATHICGKKIFTGIPYRSAITNVTISKRIYIFRDPYCQFNSLKNMRIKMNHAGKIQQGNLNFGPKGGLPKGRTTTDLVLNCAINCLTMYNAMILDLVKSDAPTYIIWYNDLIDDTIGTMNQLFDFIGLEAYDANLDSPPKIKGLFSGDPTGRASTKINEKKAINPEIKELLDTFFNISSLIDQFPLTGLLDQKYRESIFNSFSSVLEGVL